MHHLFGRGVYGKTLKQHLERVDQVLEKIGRSDMKLKPEKCHLLQESQLSRLCSVQRWYFAKCGQCCQNSSAPGSITEIRQFLGMTSYYRRFFQKLCHDSKPNGETYQKGGRIPVDSKCEKSFQTLKKILAGPEIMAFSRDGE